MIEDLSTLAGAVSVIGEPILFIAAPARATAMQLRSRGPLPFRCSARRCWRRMI